MYVPTFPFDILLRKCRTLPLHPSFNFILNLNNSYLILFYSKCLEKKKYFFLNKLKVVLAKPSQHPSEFMYYMQVERMIILCMYHWQIYGCFSFCFLFFTYKIVHTFVHFKLMCVPQNFTIFINKIAMSVAFSCCEHMAFTKIYWFQFDVVPK